mmetsp:Transcript_15093/g.45701  ORF Transcript_15093/g.45701 Transcript_15093/m.45701 type:complete len:104 (+) Transcript_15093:721-1032(+)
MTMHVTINLKGLFNDCNSFRQPSAIVLIQSFTFLELYKLSDSVEVIAFLTIVSMSSCEKLSSSIPENGVIAKFENGRSQGQHYVMQASIAECVELRKYILKFL